MSQLRVRFAPSPTGHVHIGNIRVAIFNWLRARQGGGRFLLRIEDTDQERSTPEAIRTLLEAMEWLGLDYDEEPLFQSRQAPAHRAAADRMAALGHADRVAGGAVVMRIARGLFDPSFISEAREEAVVDVSGGSLGVAPRGRGYGFEYAVRDSGGKEFVTPYQFDALEQLALETDNGGTFTADDLIRFSAAASAAASAAGADGGGGLCPEGLASALGGRPVRLRFRRRHVFFDDMVLGRLEKPLESLRDFVIVRSDGNPVFHLANVVDDNAQGVTEILRGNDHVENTFRHLFIFRALGATPPRYGHFPMIVNAKGKPYSKRDGDAYVGDFRAKGYFPEALFNFLALCGWGRDDGAEVYSPAELTRAFSLDRVGVAPARMNPEKLEWMNGRHLARLPTDRLAGLVRGELAAEGIDVGALDGAWLARLADLERERLKTVKEFVANTRFFFVEPSSYDPKAAEKFLLRNDRAGLTVLRAFLPALEAASPWTETALEAAATAFADARDLKAGDLAQPLRVAATGGGVSRGIWITLELLGREPTIARIRRALEHFA